MQIAIYRLLDEEDVVRYVGQSMYPEFRLRAHQNSGRPWAVKQEIIEWTSKECWKEREIYWIAWHREQGHPLENKTRGGDGSEWTEESRERARQAKLGTKRPPEVGKKIGDSNRGKPHAKFSEEGRRNCSEAHKGLVPWNKGKRGCQVAWNLDIPQSPEVKQKLADAKRGQLHTDEVKNACADAARTKGWTPEIRQKRLATFARNRWQKESDAKKRQHIVERWITQC